MSRLDALFLAYDLALKDPAVKIPTYLHAALENARPVAPANPYAERRTQRRDDLELSVDARHIRVGQ